MPKLHRRVKRELRCEKFWIERHVQEMHMCKRHHERVSVIFLPSILSFGHEVLNGRCFAISNV